MYEIVKLLKDTPIKSCELDPVPTWLLKQFAQQIAPTICQLQSVHKMRRVSSTTHSGSGTIPIQKTISGSRCCHILPAHLQFAISVKTHRTCHHPLAEHSTTYNILPVQQSAYRPFQTTETAIVCVFNDLVLYFIVCRREARGVGCWRHDDDSDASRDTKRQDLLCRYRFISVRCVCACEKVLK